MVENGAKTRFRDVLQKLQGVCTGGLDPFNFKKVGIFLLLITLPKFSAGTRIAI